MNDRKTNVREPDDADTKHSLSQVWQEVHRHGVAIGEIQTAIKGLTSSVEQMVHAMNRPKPPIPWVAIGSLLVAVLLAGVAMSQSALRPVERDVVRIDNNQSEFLQTLPDLYKLMGAHEERLRVTAEHTGRLQEETGQTSILANRNEVAIEALREAMVGVDKRISHSRPKPHREQSTIP